jgi:hypothetical protein
MPAVATAQGGEVVEGETARQQTTDDCKHMTIKQTVTGGGGVGSGDNKGNDNHVGSGKTTSTTAVDAVGGMATTG